MSIPVCICVCACLELLFMVILILTEPSIKYLSINTQSGWTQTLTVCICVGLCKHGVGTQTDPIATAVFWMSQGGSGLIGTDWRAHPAPKPNHFMDEPWASGFPTCWGLTPPLFPSHTHHQINHTHVYTQANTYSFWLGLCVYTHLTSVTLWKCHQKQTIPAASRQTPSVWITVWMLLNCYPSNATWEKTIYSLFPGESILNSLNWFKTKQNRKINFSDTRRYISCLNLIKMQLLFLFAQFWSVPTSNQ